MTKIGRESFAAVRALSRKNDAIVVIHGTDTLAMTGETLLASMPTPSVPVILTGAIIPFVVQGSDGLQNVTEALFACRLLPPGIYAVFHGRALAFPGVVKDHDTLTFARHIAQDHERGATHERAVRKSRRSPTRLARSKFPRVAYTESIPRAGGTTLRSRIGLLATSRPSCGRLRASRWRRQWRTGS